MSAAHVAKISKIFYLASTGAMGPQVAAQGFCPTNCLSPASVGSPVAFGILSANIELGSLHVHLAFAPVTPPRVQTSTAESLNATPTAAAPSPLASAVGLSRRYSSGAGSVHCAASFRRGRWRGALRRRHGLCSFFLSDGAELGDEAETTDYRVAQAFSKSTTGHARAPFRARAPSSVRKIGIRKADRSDKTLKVLKSQ